MKRQELATGQESPDGSALGLRRRLVLGTALATTAFMGGYRGYVRRAYAACTGPAGGPYICSGAVTTTQALTGAPLTVTTAPGFSIDTTGSGGNAFTLTGTGGLTFTDSNSSNITAAYNGIYARNNGAGVLGITSTGTVTAIGRTGIDAQDSAGSGLTINAAAVSGNLDGIDARHYGTGALAITTTGAVTAAINDGVYAYGDASTSDLIIDAATVNGLQEGIEARNFGSGVLSITATGAVTGATSRGILAVGTNGSGLTIDAAAVTGGQYGIVANDFGGGALSIAASGMVTGTTGQGISILTGGIVTDATIDAADVSGGVDGVFALNYGTGALAITTTGTVTGAGEDGIFAYNFHTATGMTIDAAVVSGYSDGIDTRNYGSGALAITATGAVTGTNRNGIRARNDGAGLTIGVTSVSGGRYGIDARHYGSGALVITATGAVMGATRTGIYAYVDNSTATALTINAAAVTGATDGIIGLSRGSGALAITTTGAVTGTGGFGIGAATLYSSGLTINAKAAVSGAYYGIIAFQGGKGALSITATGAVKGTVGGGIYGYADDRSTGMTIKTADVSGARIGILARHDGSGTLLISSAGSVIGTAQAGINAFDSVRADGLTINAADVSGGTDGIYASHLGKGKLAITATGAVKGKAGSGIYAFADTAATGLTIDAKDVSGDKNGIYARHLGRGTLSIAATGTVAGHTRYGIIASDTARATAMTIDAQTVNGRIDGIDARHLGTGALAITTTGTVTGIDGTGIDASAGANASGMTIKTAKASVRGTTDGIRAANHGRGALAITTNGLVAGANGNGIYGSSDKTATSMTVTATDVSGGKDGIKAHHFGKGALAITIAGAVNGKSDTGVYAFNGSANVGSTTTVTLADGAKASGAKFGVHITSATGRAATLDNAGTIAGATGVEVQGSPVTISNAGVITGALGIHLTGGRAVLTNTGAVTGTGGTAIDLRAATGRSTLDLQAGTITRDILLSAGADTVDVGGGAIEGDITGRGKAKLDFGLGSGSFTFGAPFAITGIDQVTMNSGTVEIDGKLDAATLTVNGGKMILNGTSNLTGGTSVQGGIFSVNGRLGSDLDVLSGGRLQGTGTISGTAQNFAGGTFAPGNSIGTLTINGNYVGSGGTLEIEAALGGDASPADRLVVTGNTSGSTNVHVINLAGTGAATVEGIKIVDVGGASNGTFTLLGNVVSAGQPAVVAGVYAYTLQQNGIGTPADGDWYLRSRLAPNVPLYEAYPGVLQSLNQPGTLQQRLGNRSWTIEAQGADAVSDEVETAAGLGTWARIEGAHGKFEPESSTTGTNYDASVWKLESGLDIPIYEQEAGRLIGGVAFRYGNVSSDIDSGLGRGSIDATGYGVTGTLTWYGNSGFYLDGQANVTWYDSDIASDSLGTLASGNDGTGYSLSLEAGQRVPLDQRWSLTPQAQLAWSSVDFDDFTDPFGATVSLGDGDSLVGRLGLSADYENTWTDAAGETSRAHLYGIANLYYDFEAQYDVAVSGVSVVSDTQALWGGLGIGGSLDWANGRYSLYGEALARTSLEDFGDSHILSGTVGFRVSW